MPSLSPLNPDFEALIRGSFARQTIMGTLGARLLSVAPGEIQIELPFTQTLTQQHGFLHAGVLATIADSAGGYAALSLMPAGSAVLAVEFKVNFLSPAVGERFVATGRVLRAGRTITVCECEVVAHGAHAAEPVRTPAGSAAAPGAPAAQTTSKAVAHMLQTLMRIESRDGMRG